MATDIFDELALPEKQKKGRDLFDEITSSDQPGSSPPSAEARTNGARLAAPPTLAPAEITPAVPEKASGSKYKDYVRQIMREILPVPAQGGLELFNQAAKLPNVTGPVNKPPANDQEAYRDVLAKQTGTVFGPITKAILATEAGKKGLSELMSAAAYEAAGGVKGATLGYVDPTRVLEGTPLANENINKPAAGYAGQLVGALAPIARISKAVDAGLSATGALKSVRPVLQTLVQSGITGAIYGAAEKPEEEGLANRAHNALDSAAGFIVLTGAGKLVDQAAQAFGLGKTNVYNSLRQDIINKFTANGATPEEAAKMADVGLKEAVDKGGGWSEVKAGDLRAARRAVREGQKIVIGETNPPTVEPTAPPSEAPTGQPPLLTSTETQDLIGKPSVSPPTPAVPAPKAPEAPITPTTVLNERSLGAPTVEYLQTRFPGLAQTILNQPLPMAPETIHDALLKSTAAGEETYLRGATAQDAELAAAKVFQDVTKPHIQNAVEQEIQRKNLEATAPTTTGIGAEAGQGGDIFDQIASEPQSGQEAARTAAQEILKANKIDDRTVVNLVDQIVADNTAFKAGYGQEYDPARHIIKGETSTPIDALSGQRLQTVINLANGATKFTGRHEAFHAVTNNLLNADEQKVLLDTFGNHEKAADAFARYQTGEKPQGVIAQIFEKIRQFLEKLKGYFKDKKFSTAEDIFEAVDRGEMGARVKEPAGAEAQYSALTKPNPELEQKAIQKFGLTDNLGNAGFILNDGRMIDFGGGMGKRTAEHRDIASIFENPTETGTQEVYNFMKDTNSVRVRNYGVPGGTHLTIESQGPLSRDQLRQISDYLDSNTIKDATFDVVDQGGFSLRDDSVHKPTGEDVARFFNGSSQYSAEPIEPPKEEPPREGFNEGNFEPTKWEKVKQELYDRFNPIKYKTGKAIQPELKQAGGLYTKAYVMARELNGKIRGISESLFKDLNQRIKPLRSFEDRQLLNKIYSLRNLADLDRIGKTTSGITADQVKTELEAIKKDIGSERYDRISKVADDLADLQNNKALNILIDGKVITKQTADLLRERYPNYLRSEVMDEALANKDPQFKRADNGEPLGRINKSFLKTKQGTELQINDDVLDVIRRSLVTKVAAAQKQLVIDQIAEDFGKEIGRQTFKEGSLVTEVNPKAILQGYVKSSAKASGGRVFAVRQDVADLLEGLNQKQADFITKAMSSYNRIFRAGATTLRVPFLFNNIFRDTQEALFKARSVPGDKSQMISYVKGAFHALRNTLGISDSVYNAWSEAGAAYGGAVSSIPKNVEIPLRLQSPMEKVKIVAQGAVALPFETVAKLAEFSENTSRLAEWIRLEGSKLHPDLKALQSRDITVDFEKVGDAMKRINQLVPFLNANVQGTVNTLRAFKDQPLVSIARMIAYVMIPAVVAYEWNKRFKNEEDVDPYIKNSYWHINSGIEVEQDGKKLPVLFTIRKGEFSQQISYYVNTLLEYANKDPNFQQKLKDFTTQGTLDNLISSFVPPIMRVPIEEAANRNFFTGRPIITQSIENVTPARQFKPGTTNTMRRLGELTGISPARLEHVATGAFPATQQILEASDALLNLQPEIKRKNIRVFPLQNTVPIVRTPSGFFNQQEAAAREFEQKSKEDTRTRNFLFEQSYRQYLESPTGENAALFNKYRLGVPGPSQRMIMSKVRKQKFINSLPPEQRARALLPKKLQGQYQRNLASQ